MRPVSTVEDAEPGEPPTQRWSWLTDFLAGALLCALTLYLAFQNGGFFPGATGLAAAEMALAVAAMAAIGRARPEQVHWWLWLSLVAISALAVWTFLSSAWSDSTARVLPEYVRTLLYALTLALFCFLPPSARRIRWMIYGFALAIVIICAFALVARLLPQLILDTALPRDDYRLAYPLTYWNALGLLAGLGVIVCGHLSCSTRDPVPVRIAGAASVPLLTLTLYYTLSRGAAWAALAGVFAYVLIGRPRGVISGALATLPTTLVVLIVANPPNALNDATQFSPGAIAAGHHIAAVVIGCMVLSAVLRACLLRIDRLTAELTLQERLHRSLVAGCLAVVFMVVVVGLAVGDAPDVVRTKYSELTGRDSNPGGGSSRLFSASTNGRKEHWQVAMDAFRRNKLHGSGAGTYALLWAKGRAGSVHVVDAHSLYIETLGELGLVGFVLLVVVIALILGAFAYRARGPDRAMFAALLAAGLAWAAASGVDWDWEMPATTVWLFAFGGAALARTSRARQRPWPWAWSAAVRIVAVVACLAVAVIPARVSIAAGRFGNALDNLKSGDCQSAKREARSALSAVGQRAAPYTLIAFCEMREGRYRSAVAAARAARARDPHNWETNYSLAVARAAAGLNPRAAARRAAILNPNDPHAASASVALGGHDRQAWIAAGRTAVLLPPTAGDP